VRTSRILTGIAQLPTVSKVMKARITSLVVLLILAGGAVSGVPLHSNEQECSMPDMAGMDCCKKAAQAESLTPEVSTARLCCALNCSQSGTTGSTESRLPRPSTSETVAVHPASVQPLLGSPHLSFRSSWADSPPPYSNPAYIRHLALLI
jgi:hypothetical protein